MKIAFIRPSMFGHNSKDAMYPLVFAITKAITPKDVEIIFYDERVEKIPESIDADIIAMTVETFSAKRAYLLAKKYKEQGKIVLLGGFHPTACPDEAIEYCDSVLIGEIESIWKKIINDIKNNALKKFYKTENLIELSKIKYDYSAFKGKKYNNIGLIQFSRGCKYSCEFCSVHAFFKNSIRTKPIDIIIEEIKQIKEKFLFFIDDNLFSNEQEAIKLFEKLIPLKRKWACQISIDAAKNTALLKLMKKAGCTLVLIGFESLNNENLKQMGKGANLQNNDYKKIINNIYNAGIMIYGTFVIGYDNDTKETASNLMNFAIENKFVLANFNPLMPMPGTKLYDRLKAENMLVYDKWWLDDNYLYGNAMLTPKNMTTDDLMNSCKNARYKFNSFKNIFIRLLNFKSNCRNLQNISLFLLGNIVSKIEIHTKQGKKLGGE
ncbi:B12-binding domain-containing radical SAM protein [bacterium]|nr:B12-binding domain-containing radical SAM protein [bacterium]